MGKATYILRDGTKRTVEMPDGTALALYARANQIPGILAECGGNMACGTCHVYVAEDWLSRLPEPSDNEKDMLEGTAAPQTDRSRLSCQLKMSAALDGIVVEMPPEQ